MNTELKASIKERPILFNGDMIRAILDGRKTMTRRLVKDAPTTEVNHRLIAFENGWNWQVDQKGVVSTLHRDLDNPIQCPHGKVGDRLWVRETWARYNIDQNSFDIAYRSTPPNDWPKDGLWRPSIFMPRWASRILLEITAVRIERLNDISEEDAIAEGVERHVDEGIVYYGPFGNGDARPEIAFQKLWQSINGAESWDSNPWVWVIEFKRVSL